MRARSGGRLLAAATIELEHLVPPCRRAGDRPGETDAHAMLNTAEAGSAWTLVYPDYAVVAPQPARIEVQLAYPMPRGQAELKAWIDTWILTERSQGSIDALFEHWILGRSAGRKGPRGSILNNVLRARSHEAKSQPSESPAPEVPDS